MLEILFERRASSTKRLHNAGAKTCGEDHATFFEIPILWLRRRRLERKLPTNRSKSDENQRQIDEKSMKNRLRPPLGAPGRSGPRTRSERAWSAKLAHLGRQAGRLGRHVGRLGRHAGGPGGSKHRSGPTQRHARSVPARSSSSFASPTTL